MTMVWHKPEQIRLRRGKCCARGLMPIGISATLQRVAAISGANDAREAGNNDHTVLPKIMRHHFSQLASVE